MSGSLSLIVSLIGLVIFLISSHPKFSEVGKILFWTGMLAFLIANGGQFIGLRS